MKIVRMIAPVILVAFVSSFSLITPVQAQNNFNWESYGDEFETESDFDNSLASADAQTAFWGVTQGMFLLICCFALFGIVLMLVTGYLVYQDANKLGLDNAAIIAILIAISMFSIFYGILMLILYAIAVRPNAPQND